MNSLTMYKNGFSKGLITGLILMLFAGRGVAQVSKVWVIGQEFVAKPDKWIGAKVGLFCISKPDVRMGGYADFDWFRVDK